MTLFDRVFGGNDAVYGLTEAAIDGAIAQYGADAGSIFPGHCIQPSLLLCRNRKQGYQPGRTEGRLWEL